MANCSNCGASVDEIKINSRCCNQRSWGLVPSFTMDGRDKKQDNKPNYYDNRWYESNSFWEGIGCLFDLAFIGCMVPMVMFVVVVGFCGSGEESREAIWDASSFHSSAKQALGTSFLQAKARTGSRTPKYGFGN